MSLSLEQLILVVQDQGTVIADQGKAIASHDRHITELERERDAVKAVGVGFWKAALQYFPSLQSLVPGAKSAVAAASLLIGAGGVYQFLPPKTVSDIQYVEKEVEKIVKVPVQSEPVKEQPKAPSKLVFAVTTSTAKDVMTMLDTYKAKAILSGVETVVELYPDGSKLGAIPLPAIHWQGGDVGASLATAEDVAAFVNRKK